MTRVLPSGLPDQVADEEFLARFLTSSRHYSIHKQLVKPEAFLPEERHRETSVFRHSGETRDVLWAIGTTVVGSESTRRLHGATLFRAAAVRGAGLEVVADEPPPLHAAIRAWPWPEDPKLRKAAHKEISTKLASAAGTPLLLSS